MNPREPLIGFLFALFLAVLWLGFLFHQDQRFAGSLIGGILAVSGSLFLLIPLFYSLIKRVPALKTSVTKKISFSTLLTIHILSGFIGAILVLIHTGHKFDGSLATALTAMLLIVVFSGYIGRYLLSRISKEVVDKKQLLSALETQYGNKVVDLHAHPEERQLLVPFSGFFSRILGARLFGVAAPEAAQSRALSIFSLAESIADVEFAISTHETFKRIFSIWLKLHIVLSSIFYLLLVLHIGGEYYFGLRWFI